jgi:hypothetical protein
MKRETAGKNQTVPLHLWVKKRLTGNVGRGKIYFVGSLFGRRLLRHRDQFQISK